MEQISSAVGVDADKEMFHNATQTLYSQWKGLALGSNNKMESVYGKPSTWTIGYGLYPDKWLGLDMIDSVVCKAGVSPGKPADIVTRFTAARPVNCSHFYPTRRLLPSSVYPLPLRET